MNDPVHYHVVSGRTPLTDKTVEILQRRIGERCGIAVEESAANADLVLAVHGGIGAEGYRISDEPGGGIRITGNDERGLLYGVGKFLRTSRYEAGRFTPSSWRGTSVPECHVRGMYWAFHNNFYPNAPLPELIRYAEDLALWGLNSLVFHIAPKDDNSPLATPDQMKPYRPLFAAARQLGLRVGLLASANIGRNDAPPEIRAAGFPDTKPERRGHFGVRVCPSHPQGFAYLSKMLDDYLAGCEGIGLDYVVAFPYDSGGCGCQDCWPWGARGYVKMCREFSRLARARYPQCKFVMGTWCFDVRDESDGEYEGLARELERDKSWVDVIMDDAHVEFPRYCLDHGVPGGLPLVNFAEISMWGRYPWGGCGANPLPERLQRIWNQSGHALDGGFPYSEGKYEDLNKFIFSQFFWKRSTPVRDAVREYVAGEFAPAVVDEVTEAIYLLERTYPRQEQKREDVVRAYDLLQAADATLPASVRESWRWRILLLRATIDFERATHEQRVTDRCDAAYEELIRISHLRTAWEAVTPPSRSRLAWREEQKQKKAPPPPGSDSGI